MVKELALEFESREQERQVRRILQRNASKSSLFDETLSQDMSTDTYWIEGEWDDVENPCLRCLIRPLILLKCLPEDRADFTPVKNALRILQWLAMVSDIGAAIVAIVTFNGVTYCCGNPILNFDGMNLPWDIIVRILTWVYLGLILVEIYPVVKMGIPFNIVNPLFGLVVAVAMFFDDSKSQALLMWGIETLAVLCEYGILLLKMHQREFLAREVKKAGKLTSRKREERFLETAIDKDEAEAEIARNRQEYYRLKLEQKREAKLLWYLRLANYINISLVCIMLGLIVVISNAGGLCVHDNAAPNPFSLNQLAKCPACTEIDGFCEVCGENVKQCYFPYS